MNTNDFNRFNSSEKYRESVRNISEAMIKGKLVFFIGAGVSRIQGYAGWNGYINKLFCYWMKETSHINSPKIKNALEKIKNSKMDNARKVDLLYEVLEDILSEKEFNERKTEFEKCYFINKEPTEKYNDVLLKLSELDATYLTTNYDNQIEKHLNLMKNKSYPITDMSDLNNKMNDDVFVNTVVHMHGTPYGSMEDFISSGDSYKNHYYVDNQITKNIREWLEKRNVTFVFIGSSMEEGEVLSLIPNNSKNIAIMKADDDGESSDYIRKIKSNFYHNKNDTTVLWYGDNYDDLPSFIEKLKNDILSNVKKDNNYMLINEIRNPRISSDRIIKLINTQNSSTINNALPGIVDENKNKILKNIARIRLLDDRSSNLSEPLYNIFLEGIDYLTNSQINRIVKYMSYDNNSYKYINANLFFEKCSLDEVELDGIYKNLSSRIDIEFTSFSQNDYVMGWKIVKDIISEDSNNYYMDTTNFNLSVSAENELINCILNPDIIEKTKLIGGELMLEEHREFQGLFRSILNDRLNIEGISWENCVENRIFKSSIFIKLLMVIYKERGLDIVVIKKVIENANFHDKYLGSDFGEFVRENIDLIKAFGIKLPKMEYVDNIRILGRNPVILKSIIDYEELEKESMNILMNKVTNHDYEYGNLPIKDSNNHIICIDKTIDFFKDVLNSKRDECIKKVFNLIMYNDGQKNMFKMYKNLSEWILNKYKKLYDKDELFRFICSNYKSINSFQSIDSIIFGTMIRDGNRDVIDKYLNIDFSCLNKPSGDFDIIGFMNSDLGRYLLLFNDVLQRDSSYIDVIKKKIEGITDKKIKNFMVGRHYEIFKKDKFNDLYNLIGFSSNNEVTDSYTHKFSNSVKLFFRDNGNYNIDRITMNNIFYVALQEFRPRDDFSIKDELASEVFDVLLYDDNVLKYEEDWVIYFYKLNSNEFINKILLYSSIRKNVDKLLKIIFQIKNYILSQGIPKVRPTFYINILNSSKELTKELGDLLYMCANKDNIKSYNMQIVEFILLNVPVEKRSRLLIILEPHITHQEYDDFVSRFIHV